MADNTDKRASLLASTALGLFKAGRLEDAARALREAIHLAPQNPQVRAAFQHIQETQDSGSKIPELCRKLLEDGNVESGSEAVKIVQSGGNLTADQAKAIVLAVVQYEGGENIKALAGKLLAAVVNHNTDGKTVLTAMVTDKGTRQRIFEKVLELGAEAAESLTSTVLDVKTWKGDQRDTVERAWFRYLLGQLAKEERAEPSIRPISRMLAADAQKLQSLIGKHEFIDFITLITNGSKEDTRTGALLAAAKYLESIESELSLQLLGDFLTTRLASDDDDEMALAFNVAAALFPVAASSLSNLFHTDGFVQNLVPSLQGRPQTVELAAINLMSAACIDKTCRDAVSKNCEEYLTAVAATKSDASTAASLALAKLSGDTPAPPPGQKEPVKPSKTDKEIEELASTFKNLLSSSSDASKQQSVEGLAYTSLTPSVKETLAADSSTVKSLLGLLNPSTSASIVFGVLTTIDNLTRYTKPLTEEQLKMAQLKNYANATPSSKTPGEIPKLDQDPYVNKRCQLLLAAGVVPALVRLAKKTSPQATALTSSIILSLSKVSAHRGIMAQQGAVKLLLQIYSSLPTIPTPSSSDPDSTSPEDRPESTVHTIAAHALSRLLISVNPSLAFSASVPINSSLPPLLNLIKSIHNSTADSRDLLPLFEALLALTNLASTTDSIRSIIVKKEFTIIEELLLHANDMIQRAAVELVCNLMVAPETVSLFVEGPRSGNRLQMLLAIAQADDVPSRLAAGGALAMLTEWDAGVKKILEREGGVQRILEMCEDEEDGVVFRGVVVVRNLVIVGGEDGLKKVKEEGGADVLKRILEEAVAAEEKNGDMISALVEVLKVLVK
ncbi:uncharacterized protein DFL_003250 [Arthrobotrys flagrans]|uniref:UNC-45/Cro1/She4 central domain-containing protein n=1 Tax=Arthrobotrys flagrans TaxID=97331 RepID=A0A437A111_ARTFL|nr:hypothetical protein DFL_003250 [Arthrobotrys flagrans]